LLRNLGQHGSVLTAACVNALVGLAAVLYGYRVRAQAVPSPDNSISSTETESAIPLSNAIVIAGISGFIALGFEICWFRVFELASHDPARAFALLLSTFLAGIAAGSFISEKAASKRTPTEVARAVGVLLLIAGAGSVYLPPLVAFIEGRGLLFVLAAPVFFVLAGVIGSVLPLLCRLGVSAGSNAGSHVSWTYASNILGSTVGSLLIGFVWMQHFGLKDVSEHLGFLAVAIGAFIIFRSRGEFAIPPRWALAIMLIAVVAVPASLRFYAWFFEKLIFARNSGSVSLAHVVENRNGVIAITSDAAAF
jgi:spermidine synthase